MSSPRCTSNATTVSCRINLLLALDNRCVQGCAVTLASSLSRLEGDSVARVFLVTHGLSGRARSALHDTVRKSGEGHTLEFINFDPRSVAVGLARSRLITPMAYVTCVMDRILPRDVCRCLYMDCDIVATRDLSELWKTELAGYSLAAVDDGNRPVLLEHQARLGLREPRYFNSGVLLVDLERWRERRVGERALATATRIGPRLILHDQDALNVALQGDWLALEPAWNTWTILPGLTPDDRVLFHFMGAPKPWHADYDRPFGELFFAELDRTPLAGWRPWNPMGLGRGFLRMRRRLPWIPGAIRAARARLSPSASQASWQPEHET